MIIKDLEWTTNERNDSDIISFANTSEGTFSVLDRMTGWGGGGFRDTETGFRDCSGKFWLASGMFDIRTYPDLTIDAAIVLVKSNSNICIGV